MFEFSVALFMPDHPCCVLNHLSCVDATPELEPQDAEKVIRGRIAFLGRSSIVSWIYVNDPGLERTLIELYLNPNSFVMNQLRKVDLSDHRP